MKCVKCNSEILDYSNAYGYLFSKNENGDFVVDYQLCENCTKGYVPTYERSIGNKREDYIKINKNKKQKTYTQVQDEKGFYYVQDTFNFFVDGKKIHFVKKTKEFKEILKKVIEKKEEELKVFQEKINELYLLLND